MTKKLAVAHLLIAVTVPLTTCARRAPSPEASTIRLVDRFKPDAISGTPTDTPRTLPKTEWRFDGPAPAANARAATRGWEAGPGIAGLAVREGRLVGRTTSDLPILHVERTSGLDNLDQLHAVEVRMRASAGSNLALQVDGREKIDLVEAQKGARSALGLLTAPIVAANELRTYTLTTALHIGGSGIRHLLLRPTDVAGATFEIESVRLVFRKEHLATIPSGVAWQGLKEIYRESLAARAPETIRFTVNLPDRPWLDLAVGTLEDFPVTFRVGVRGGDARTTEDENLVEYTVTTPHRWEPRPIDLARFAGQTVELSLSLASPEQGALGFWGTPVVRSRAVTASASGARVGRPSGAPRGVILIQADTLRLDHLDVYGHGRETAPVLRWMAADGTLLRNYIVQATWTKVSTPSLMTSLYPTSHGVLDFSDHLPASANTLAESYRAAGYATLSLASVLFTGQFTNLHQGFEELHEDGSFSRPGSSKTAREYVDRLQAWLETHRDVPFFVFLHVFDPHDPYEPYRPYDSLWADPSHKEEHERQLREVRKHIKDPLLQRFGMPSRDDLVAAGFDPEKYVDYDRGWYDGSIRAMDVEIGRLLERLRELGLDDETLVVFLSDHGEEFHEHGQMFHGQTVYSELTRVPFIARWPGGVARGKAIDEPVQSIDVMPTLLELSGLPQPAGLQGQSFAALLTGVPATTRANDPSSAFGLAWANLKAGLPALAAAQGQSPAGWKRRPAISEKARTSEAVGSPPPRDTESYAIVDGSWKLIRNTIRPRGGPEYELYDTARDPLDKTDVAAQHPEVVARLSKALDGWKQMAQAARLKPDTETTKGLSPEQLQRLRSLGYIR